MESSFRRFFSKPWLEAPGQWCFRARFGQTRQSRSIPDTMRGRRGSRRDIATLSRDVREAATDGSQPCLPGREPFETGVEGLILRPLLTLEADEGCLRSPGIEGEVMMSRHGVAEETSAEIIGALPEKNLAQVPSGPRLVFEVRRRISGYNLKLPDDDEHPRPYSL